MGSPRKQPGICDLKWLTHRESVAITIAPTICGKTILNYDELTYNLGFYAKAKNLSPQCAKVRELLFADAASDRERLERIQQFLIGFTEIEEDTVKWLIRGIPPHFGEKHILDVSAAEESDFWYALHVKYPQHASLLFVTANFAFMANWLNALELLFQALELDSSLINADLDRSVSEAIDRSPFRLKYLKLSLAIALERNYEEFLHVEIPELQDQFAGDVEALRLIDEAIGL